MVTYRMQNMQMDIHMHVAFENVCHNSCGYFVFFLVITYAMCWFWYTILPASTTSWDQLCKKIISYRSSDENKLDSIPFFHN